MTASPGPPEWPPRWELSAPETHVLQHRGSAYADEPFRLAVKELVARRVLRIEPIRKAGRDSRRTRYALTKGRGSTTDLAAPLRPVLDLYRDTRPRTIETVRDESTHVTTVDGVLVKDLAKAARKRFKPIDRYREEHVVPALVSRGLLEVSGTRGFPRRPDYDWTPAGLEADALLERWLALVRENIAGWTAGGLERALTYPDGAGAALLLLDDLYADLDALGRRRREAGAGDSGGEGGSAEERDPGEGSEPLPSGDQSLDFGGADFDGFEFGGLDFGGLGNLGELTPSGGDGGGGGEGGGQP